MSADHIIELARAAVRPGMETAQQRGCGTDRNNPAPRGASQEKLREILRTKPYTATPSEAISILMCWPTRSQADGCVVGISPTAKNLWMWLYAEYSRLGRRTVQYSVSQLGALLGVHTRSVQRYLSELEATGWLSRDYQSGWAPQRLSPQLPAVVAEHCLQHIPDRLRPAPGHGPGPDRSSYYARKLERIRAKAQGHGAPDDAVVHKGDKDGAPGGDKFGGIDNSDRKGLSSEKIPRRQTKRVAESRLTQTRNAAQAIACENKLPDQPVVRRQTSPQQGSTALPRQLTERQHQLLESKVNALDSQSWPRETVFQEAYSAITMGTLRRLDAVHAINMFAKLWENGDWRCGRQPSNPGGPARGTQGEVS